MTPREAREVRENLEIREKPPRRTASQMAARTARAHIAVSLHPAPSLQPRNIDNPAAVLVPIVSRPRPSVLLTLRPEGLSRHAGQICFPGGRFHATDADLLDTALRETEEEIGLSRSLIEVAGFLDPYRTGTGYTVLPVVGFLGEEFEPRPDAREVAEIFEVPLDHLLDPANHEQHRVERAGALRTFHAISYGERLIWGATAAMIVNFAERLGLR